jgi:hypothetical protein
MVLYTCFMHVAYQASGASPCIIVLSVKVAAWWHGGKLPIILSHSSASYISWFKNPVPEAAWCPRRPGLPRRRRGAGVAPPPSRFARHPRKRGIGGALWALAAVFAIVACTSPVNKGSETTPPVALLSPACGGGTRSVTGVWASAARAAGAHTGPPGDPMPHK